MNTLSHSLQTNYKLPQILTVTFNFVVNLLQIKCRALFSSTMMWIKPWYVLLSLERKELYFCQCAALWFLCVKMFYEVLCLKRTLPDWTDFCIGRKLVVSTDTFCAKSVTIGQAYTWNSSPIKVIIRTAFRLNGIKFETLFGNLTSMFMSSWCK